MLWLDVRLAIVSSHKMKVTAEKGCTDRFFFFNEKLKWSCNGLTSQRRLDILVIECPYFLMRPKDFFVIGDLLIVGWDEGPGAPVTPIKATRLGLSYLIKY